jgi:hypothetical protein
VSEFSSSFHIWTDNSADAEQRLRRSKVSGIVFGPADHWLTFVPYANLPAYRRRVEPADFTADLSRIVGCPVLHYRYAEDHGWTFALAQPRAAFQRFACWWGPVPTVDRDGLDPDALAPFAQSEGIEPLLQALDRQSASVEQPAYRFAELLGLAAYKWLSPDLAQSRTADLLAQGGRKLGTRPPDTAEQLQLPPSRHISLPRPDLSAREVLSLVEPIMTRFGPPWYLAWLGTYGRIQADGRGDWRFSYRHGDRGDPIHVSLIARGEIGRLSLRSQAAPAFARGDMQRTVPLSDDWLDSTDVAAIVARQPVPDEIGKAYPGAMQLASQHDVPFHWVVIQHPVDRAREFVSWKLVIEAVTGQLVLQTLARLFGNTVIDTRTRARDGSWTDVPCRSGPPPRKLT